MFCYGRGFRLAGLPVQPDGTVVCPGHGLRWHLNTGRLVPRGEVTAWDNLGQERVFFRGLELLQATGVPAKHLMVYMLIGYKPGETIEEILYRYGRLKAAGCLPYPMVYEHRNPLLKRFQRWAIRYGNFVPWEDYQKSQPSLQISQPALML